MAKARPIPNLAPDDPYIAAASKVISVRTREVIEHSRGVLDMDEIEGVHDMRVATRRLRAALEIFAPCYPKKAHRAALRDVKALADALGERRDRDVAIAALKDFSTSLDPADHAGVATLVERLRQEQHEANEALRPHVAPERLAALTERVFELLANPKHQVTA